ncbi:unnamed protein product [Schistosoma turkestanicum]|nr:unnamed protein product [Schistosoma turkestanicum]
MLRVIVFHITLLTCTLQAAKQPTLRNKLIKIEKIIPDYKIKASTYANEVKTMTQQLVQMTDTINRKLAFENKTINEYVACEKDEFASIIKRYAYEDIVNFLKAEKMSYQSFVSNYSSIIECFENQARITRDLHEPYNLMKRMSTKVEWLNIYTCLKQIKKLFPLHSGLFRIIVQNALRRV